MIEKSLDYSTEERKTQILNIDVCLFRNRCYLEMEEKKTVFVLLKFRVQYLTVRASKTFSIISD